MSIWVSVFAAISAFAVSAILGVILIPMLRKLKFGQTILDIGPRWHKSKQGTPTMGGLLFAGGTIVGIIVGIVIMISGSDWTGSSDYVQQLIKMITGLIMALAFGFVGFIDDYIKVAKKRNLGLRARDKLFMQSIISALYLWAIYLSGDTSTLIKIPFIGQFDLGIFYFPIAIIFIIFIVNAVNLTDGIDGLCGSVTFIYALVFMMICTFLDFRSLNIYAVSLAASILGFLIWNYYPAKVFMGDTGSMFLGGSVIALGIGAGLHVLIIIAGIIYIVEALSVVLQVISFKTTGKRIFKMSPIHHHFEMSDWSEVKIVTVFSLVTVIAGGIAILCALYGI